MKYLLILSMFLGLAYLSFPFKVILSSRLSDDRIKIVEILYGLPSESGSRKIEDGEYFPGGDVVGVDPKYVILIQNKIGPFTFTDYVTKIENEFRSSINE